MKVPELLAPAGSMESLKAAVAAGCDAVYLGLTSFSARAFAGNFTHEQFQEAVRYCHVRNVRVYVTINTMLYETEIENAKKEVDFLYHNDADALLIQDFGLFHYVRTCYPDFDVHCSTQMHIHNLAGVRQMQQDGAARVVIARETPIELIREACRTGMEIEVFVYGAICISYSGQCLMSSALKNRSANKGMCAQCCRLKYFDENGGKMPEGEYLLSPKDLNVIDHLGELAEAGVSSLKIEGRMKRPEYVYLVVKTFREALDSLAQGKKYKVSKERQKELLLMFNRGFSKGHLFHDDVRARMSQYRPNHMGITIGEVTAAAKGKVEVRLSDTLYQHDGLRILREPEDIGLTAVKIEKNGRLVSKAEAGDTVWLSCTARPLPKKGLKLQKTSDAMLIDAIDRQIARIRYSDVRVSWRAAADQPFAVEVTDERDNTVCAESEFITQQAKNAGLRQEQIENALSKTGDLPYRIAEISGETGNVFIPVSVMNETRRKAFEMLTDQRAILHPDRTEKREYSFEVRKKDNPSFRILMMNPDDSSVEKTFDETAVFRMNDPVCPQQDEKENMENMVISQAGDLYMNLSGCIAGITMNIANSYAMAYILSKEGIDSLVFSSEAGNEQIAMALDGFEKRYGFRPAVFRLVYGRRTLMYIKDCFIKDRSVRTITDLHANAFELSYNSNKAELRETHPYTSDNPYCWGSAIIAEGKPEIDKETETEAYEEIYGRIQGIRP